MINIIFHLLAAMLAGIFTDFLLMCLLKQKRFPFSMILSVLTMLILYKTFGEEVQVIKGFLFAQILIFIGNYDVKTKTIPDIVAVENSVISQYSNGFVEGNNNRLKLIKRQMYERAKLPLLKAKVIIKNDIFLPIFNQI